MITAEQNKAVKLNRVRRERSNGRPITMSLELLIHTAEIGFNYNYNLTATNEKRY